MDDTNTNGTETVQAGHELDATDPDVVEGAAEAVHVQTDTGQGVGIIRELADLPPGAIIGEAALAKLMHRHPASIKRAVSRGELPQPTRLLGGPCWTAAAILRHVEARLDAAAKDAEKTARRVEKLRP